MTGIIFDPSINIGTILSSIIVLGGGLSFLMATVRGAAALHGRLDEIEKDTGRINTRLDNVDAELAKQTQILVTMAVTQEQVRALQARVESLESDRARVRVATAEQ